MNLEILRDLKNKGLKILAVTAVVVSLTACGGDVEGTETVEPTADVIGAKIEVEVLHRLEDGMHYYKVENIEEYFESNDDLNEIQREIAEAILVMSLATDLPVDGIVNYLSGEYEEGTQMLNYYIENQELWIPDCEGYEFSVENRTLEFVKKSFFRDKIPNVINYVIQDFQEYDMDSSNTLPTNEVAKEETVVIKVNYKFEDGMHYYSIENIEEYFEDNNELNETGKTIAEAIAVAVLATDESERETVGYLSGFYEDEGPEVLKYYLETNEFRLPDRDDYHLPTSDRTLEFNKEDFLASIIHIALLDVNEFQDYNTLENTK